MAEPIKKTPQDAYASKAAVLLDDGPEPEQMQVERTPCNDVHVVATRDGTYPERGGTYGIYRKQGEVFELNYLEDYASHRKGGWMRRIKQGEQIPQEVAPTVPQTAQRGQRVPRQTQANPFPPMG